MEVTEALSITATHIYAYATKWRIKVNSRKCKIAPFHRETNRLKQTIGDIYIDGETIDTVETYQFLGVIFDRLFTFSEHCSYVARVMKLKNRILQILGGTTWGADTKTLEQFRKAYVDPVGMYGAAAYVPHCSATNLQKVERVRNAAVRISTGCTRSTKISNLRQLVSMKSLRQLSTKQAAILVDKAPRLHKHCPVSEEMSFRVSLKTKSRVRDDGTNKLATTGILALPRIPFGPPIARDESQKLSKVQFAPISQKEDIKSQLHAAKALVSNLRRERPTATEIWTDGSLKHTPDTW